MNLACVSQMIKMRQTLLRTWIQTRNVLRLIGLDSFHLARIIVKEVRIRAISFEHIVINIILVNYSVVSGGAALIGGSLIAATSIFTPAAGALVLGNN